MKQSKSKKNVLYGLGILIASAESINAFTLRLSKKTPFFKVANVKELSGTFLISRARKSSLCIAFIGIAKRLPPYTGCLDDRMLAFR
jgi:hypothetical protein